MDETVEALVGTFYERLWNAWDDRAVEEILAADVTFRGSMGQQTEGRDEWRAYRDQIRCGAPDFHNEVIDLVATESRAAARLLYTGTHLGPLLEVRATGRTFAYAGAAFFTVTAGLLADIWVLGDLAGLREQLS